MAAILAAIVAGGASPEGTTTIRLTEAAQRGAFNVGAAQANINTEPDAETLRLDFTMPPGTAVGLWAKGFPRPIDATTVDEVHVSVGVGNPAIADQIAVTLEIKGTKGTQRVPLTRGLSGRPTEALVDWKTVGTIQEVVVSVNPVGAGGLLTGSIDVDVRFDPLPWAIKANLSQPSRIVGVAIFSLTAAGLAWLIGLTLRVRPGAAPPDAPIRPDARRFGGLRRDVCLGVGVVMVAALGLMIGAVGGLSPLDVIWHPVTLAGLGIVVSAWFGVGLTGKWPTPGDVLRDGLATGVLAASSAPLFILQAPANWSEMLALSQPVAALVAIIYHAANAYRLATTGRRLGPIGGLLIVITPYVIGMALLLESTELLELLGHVTSVGLANSPGLEAFLGRVLALFLFNEAVANGLGLATRRKLLRPVRAHLALLAVAVIAVAGHPIAAWGSGASVASMTGVFRWIAVVSAAAMSQAGLWAEVYLLTGMVMDALHGTAPSVGSTSGHPLLGLKKGMVYSATFMAILNGIALFVDWPTAYRFAMNYPLIVATFAGALVFPLVKTVIETFDGSQAFFRRVGKSYRNPVLYARGAIAGLGLGYGLAAGMSETETWGRVLFGFVVGAATFAGVDLLKDVYLASDRRGRVRNGRLYLVHALLGGAIAGAIGFYLDAAQVAAVVDKYRRYVAAGSSPVPVDVRPLLSQWGLINLGTVTGGVGLLFTEALAGVINMSVPAWLFAINRTFMAAFFRKESAPIRALFTREGVTQLFQNMIEVLRWGLWMAPVINSFLRQTGEPTWYNQDGAIRTGVALVHDLTSTTEVFRDWSLGVFVALLAHDGLRILIWLDHFGLRVATMVNLSFLGMDKLDERLSRFLAPNATARCIPEAVKRFTTWAPLLLPFYIPRGANWDLAWDRSRAIIAHESGGPLASFAGLSHAWQATIVLGASLATSAAFTTARLRRERSASTRQSVFSLSNADYEVQVKDNGEVMSQVRSRGYDLTRRSYDGIDPAGRALFLVETTDDNPFAWPIVGNAPRDRALPTKMARDDRSLSLRNENLGIRSTIEIALPGVDDSAELWTITLENLEDRPRRLEVVPYLEWVLNRAEADRGHTQYNRLFAEMEFVEGLNAVLAWDKHAKAMGFLASDIAPGGFLTSRIDFIGRARSLWSSRALETLAFTEPRDTDSHPTFDPIASLLLGVSIPPKGTTKVRLLIGYAIDKARAIELIGRHLGLGKAAGVPATRQRKEFHAIGHGEIPAGTPRPYCEFSPDGRSMIVRTPFTTRPFDHTLSNALGHVMVVTNRGLHTTSSVNAQQNRVTPDWSDTVTREVPSEAFYLFDIESHDWFSPTYHPLNDSDATYEATFSVDGTATFRMTRGTIETELTVFVPPDEPTGVYRLTIRNQGDTPRRLRVAPYFQMVLAGQPEFAGPLRVDRASTNDAVFFENPRNTFRTGPAFVAVSAGARLVVTERGQFFGDENGVDRPWLVEEGIPWAGPSRDERPVAAFLVDVNLPGRGESTIVTILGQADDRRQAEAVIRKFRDPAASLTSLAETRRWWGRLLGTLTVATDNPEFDRYLDWLKYQSLAVRIWARRGFYQASGAFGFRDQLQDSVNLLWADPAIARKQILLHGSQQFLEGDVVHWFHLLQDGRTGFVGRTHASDNLLWLAWGVVDYLAATGDESILDEMTPYLEAEQPFEPLPEGKEGMGFDPLRSSREDTIYRHCMKAIDLVLDHRMGIHGLPLMGTGDWNDGLDAIGSQGRGESVWLGFFLTYILNRMVDVIGRRDGEERRTYYKVRLDALKVALEGTWRHDRYLRAFHDDGTEIGIEGSGVWEIDALTAAWAVMAGINPDRGRTVFATALRVLEKEKTILLGWPPLREDTKPYLGRSSGYPEGGSRERDVLPRSPVARRRSTIARQWGRQSRRGAGLSRDGTSTLVQNLGDPSYDGRRDRDIRWTAEPAGRRHGDHLRARPDDLERLHRRGGLDVPPGDGGSPRAPARRRQS